MGANIGTTITAWIISLEDLSDYLMLLSSKLCTGLLIVDYNYNGV